jgi:hypothetical protein
VRRRAGGSAFSCPPRPYDLRSFVSLLINAGMPIIEVARQAGYSPEDCPRTYAHSFEEFDPTDRQPAEAVIAAARSPKGDSDVRVCTRAPARRNLKTNDLALQSQADGGIRTLDPRFTSQPRGWKRRGLKGSPGASMPCKCLCFEIRAVDGRTRSFST